MWAQICNAIIFDKKENPKQNNLRISSYYSLNEINPSHYKENLTIHTRYIVNDFFALQYKYKNSEIPLIEQE